MSVTAVVPLPAGQVNTLFATLDRYVPRMALDDWITKALAWWTAQDRDHYDSGSLMPFPAAGHVHRMGRRGSDTDLNVWLALADDEGWWPEASTGLLDETVAQVHARITTGRQWLHAASDAAAAAMFAALPAVPFLVDMGSRDTAPAVDSIFELDAALWEAVEAKADRLHWPHPRAVRQAITDRLYLVDQIPAATIGYWPSNVAVAERAAQLGIAQSLFPPKTENPVWRLPCAVSADPPLYADGTPLSQAL